MTRKTPAKPQTEPEVQEESTPVTEATAPVNIETVVSEEPVSAPPAPEPEVLQTDFREKLARKSDNHDVFVPSNPASLEKAAKQVAEENGFELNRGTSVGARLLARSQKRF